MRKRQRNVAANEIARQNARRARIRKKNRGGERKNKAMRMKGKEGEEGL